MKDRYIRKVMKLLKLPRTRKTEIRRDLEEAFASAAEHGETESAVIERMGSPESFAQSVSGNLRKPHGYTGALLCLTLSLFCLGTYVFAKMLQPAEGIIGQADAMTGILVSSAGIDFSLLLLWTGLALLGAALVSGIQKYMHHRRH